MMRRIFAVAVFAFSLVGGGVLPPRGGAAEKSAAKSADGPLTYEQHIRPMLKAHCFECHGEGKRLRGGLDVRLKRLLVEGGNTGPAIVPGKKEGLLLKRIRAGDMPPGKVKLKKHDIDILERWLAGGAATLRPEPDKIGTGFLITPEEESFWSFQPVRRSEPPKVKHVDLVHNPIDAFLLARLEAKGVAFAAEADRRTLLRRAYFDLIGLPPSPDQVEAFLNDKSPDAYEKVIDGLLASPHYGERWGRHWLDIAGYADSEGFSGADPERKAAFRYRDYVIKAFNDDMPYDRFLTEQLAGDELVRPPYNKLLPEDRQKLIATGFLRMAPDGTATGGVDRNLASNQMIADTLQIVGTSILGLTVHCAQCHNHRYDPMPQTDYYQLRAIFEPALDWKNWRVPAARSILVQSEADRVKAAEIEKIAQIQDKERLAKADVYIERVLKKELAKLPENLRGPVLKARETPVKKRNAEQKKLLREHPSINVSIGSLYLYDRKAGDELKKLAADTAELRATKPAPLAIRALTEIPGKVPTTVLFNRGDHEQPADPVEPGTLTILAKYQLGDIPKQNPGLPTTGRRLAFARWATSKQNPLTARVFVNRLWLNHFGRGIVSTPADFGFLGERPSHPELLDWLASEFMAGEWRVKRMHRLIMTSRAYRQSSVLTPELRKVDPENILLGRMRLQRLEAEIVRDAMLAASGKFNAKQFGEPVPVRVDNVGQIVIGVDTNDGAGRPTGKVVSLNGEEFRRSIYVQVRRSKPLAVLETFDGPIMAPNCECRNASTVATQSLMLMNSAAVLEHAEHFAKRLKQEAGTDPANQIRLAWNLAFTAEATDQEIASARTFLAEQTAILRQQKGLANPEQMALASFCQALLTSNRFLYVD